MTRKQRIGRAFGAAARTYDDRAAVQRLAAERLASTIAALPLPPRPRILEIGCGVGYLTRALLDRLPQAQVIASDLSPEMAAACRAAVPEALHAVMDGERPAAMAGGFDLVCAGLVLQWFEDLDGSLERLCRLLKPGGHLAFSTLLEHTFAEWRQAHAELAMAAGTPDFAAPERLQHFSFEGASLRLREEHLLERHADAKAFLQSLRAIGAHTPSPGRRPLSTTDLRRVGARFEAGGTAVTYHLGYAVLRRPGAARGVFVTGTDTDVGKTVVAACMARALGADYWKPVQTGAAVDAGDTATVAALSGARTHAPAYVFGEPLSPHAAAALEGAEVRLSAIRVPSTDRPLVVEGAGGALVPLNDRVLMIDLMAALALPVVVVARSTLGTINHTLLTLQALRSRGIEVLGVVLNGPPAASNREAIERYGRVRVLAEIPYTDQLTPQWVAEQAGRIRWLQEPLTPAEAGAQA
jgi:malonyl-CoA O-methyltransferase